MLVYFHRRPSRSIPAQWRIDPRGLEITVCRLARLVLVTSSRFSLLKYVVFHCLNNPPLFNTFRLVLKPCQVRLTEWERLSKRSSPTSLRRSHLVRQSIDCHNCSPPHTLHSSQRHHRRSTEQSIARPCTPILDNVRCTTRWSCRPSQQKDQPVHGNSHPGSSPRNIGRSGTLPMHKWAHREDR